MDWHHEIGNSVIWLLQTYVIACAGFFLVTYALIKTTRWGKQFWRIGGHYLDPRINWHPSAIIALLIFFALFAVRMSVLFSFWYNGFYSALQASDINGFWTYMGLFAVLAAIHVVTTIFNAYLSQAFDIRWRVWLTEILTSDWINGQAYYRAQFLEESIDNPDQRIEKDIQTFVTLTRTLAIGALSALISLVAFTIILWSLSGPLVIGTTEINRAMVFLVYVYVIVATVIAFSIGRPLIRLNFLNELLGANFRYALVRLREYAENVAFYRGDVVEKKNLLQRFAAIINNAWALVYRGLKFDGYNLVISQIAVVFPFILQAPRFFAGTIKLGDVMQTSTAFGQVQDALSFFRTSYDTFAQYRAALNRLSGFVEANEKTRALPAITTQHSQTQFSIDHLNVTRPDGTPLIHALDLQLKPGQTLLIKGPSGSGKTTLLRAIAGLWPYATGSVLRATGTDSLFLSQRPYLPLGDLRNAIAYPANATQADDVRLLEALDKVNLSHLKNKLDEVRDWAGILSIGEQQRLAFARVLYNQPKLVFMDEATSATDEGLEYALYALLKTALPTAILVSIGHRSTLDHFHDDMLLLDGKGQWLLTHLTHP